MLTRVRLCARAERGSAGNLRVSEEATDSFRVSWTAAPGAVVRYLLTYEPVRGDSVRLETATVGGETTIVLQQLFPQTTYRVTVTPEYQSGPGVEKQIDGTTKEGNCGDAKPALTRNGSAVCPPPPFLNNMSVIPNTNIPLHLLCH